MQSVPGRSRLHALARETGAVAFFVALSVAATWPLARLLESAVAHPGDPLINTSILSWVRWALFNAPRRLFDHGVFFPLPEALAISENMLGLAPLAAGLALFATPLAVHNVLLIGGLAGSAYGAWVLGRLVSGSAWGGIVAGVAYGFCAWRLNHLAQVQHAWGLWIPLLFAALWRYDRVRSWSAGAVVGLVFLWNGLTNLHFLVFGAAALALALVVLTASSRERRTLPWLARLGVPLAVAGAILLLVLQPHFRMQQRYPLRGNVEETAGYSATLSDWVRNDSGEPERTVAPGVALVLVALAGATYGFTRRHEPAVRIWCAIALLWIAAGVALSLGLHTAVYRSAFEHLAVVNGIRAPARWAVVAYLGLSLLAALAVRLAGRWGWLAAVVFGAAVYAGSHVAPVRWYLLPERPDPVFRHLDANDPGGAVLELPIGVGGSDFYSVAGQALHHRPIFNGAGWSPPLHAELTRLFASGAIPDSLMQRLHDLGGRAIVVHADALGPNRSEVRRWLRDGMTRGELAYAGRFDAGIVGDYLFVLGRSGGMDDPSLRVLLEEAPNGFNTRPFGVLDRPSPGERVSGPLVVRGWALAPGGVRSVRIWFANRRCSAAPERRPLPQLSRLFPGYDTSEAGFELRLDSPPCGGGETDVLVEITGATGDAVTLPHVWFEWR